MIPGYAPFNAPLTELGFPKEILSYEYPPGDEILINSRLELPDYMRPLPGHCSSSVLSPHSCLTSQEITPSSRERVLRLAT